MAAQDGRLNKAAVDRILNRLRHSIRGDLVEFALPFLRIRWCRDVAERCGLMSGGDGAGEV